MEYSKKLKQITEDEIDGFIEFYDYVIENTLEMNRYGRWKKGVYPTADGIRSYIEERAMYALMENDNILGTMAVMMSQGEDYHAISWDKELQDDEVAVVHILAINPDYQGQGIGKQLINEAIELAKNSGKKAVRLDALASNKPAHHLYEERGFTYRGKQTLYADNTGWTEFYFYEYLMQ